MVEPINDEELEAVQPVTDPAPVEPVEPEPEPVQPEPEPEPTPEPEPEPDEPAPDVPEDDEGLSFQEQNMLQDIDAQEAERHEPFIPYTYETREGIFEEHPVRRVMHNTANIGSSIAQTFTRLGLAIHSLGTSLAKGGLESVAETEALIADVTGYGALRSTRRMESLFGVIQDLNEWDDVVAEATQENRDELRKLGGSGLMYTADALAMISETAIRLKTFQALTGAAYGATHLARGGLVTHGKALTHAAMSKLPAGHALNFGKAAEMMKGAPALSKQLAAMTKLAEGSRMAATIGRVQHATKLAAMYTLFADSGEADEYGRVDAFWRQRGARFMQTWAFMATPALAGWFDGGKAEFMKKNLPRMVDMALNTTLSIGFGEYTGAHQAATAEADRLGLTGSARKWHVSMGTLLAPTLTNLYFSWRTIGFRADQAKGAEQVARLTRALNIIEDVKPEVTRRVGQEARERVEARVPEAKTPSTIDALADTMKVQAERGSPDPVAQLGGQYLKSQQESYESVIRHGNTAERLVAEARMDVLNRMGPEDLLREALVDVGPHGRRELQEMKTQLAAKLASQGPRDSVLDMLQQRMKMEGSGGRSKVYQDALTAIEKNPDADFANMTVTEIAAMLGRKDPAKTPGKIAQHIYDSAQAARQAPAPDAPVEAPAVDATLRQSPSAGYTTIPSPEKVVRKGKVYSVGERDFTGKGAKAKAEAHARFLAKIYVKSGAERLGQRLPDGSVIRDSEGTSWTVAKSADGQGQIRSDDGRSLLITSSLGRRILERASVVSRPGPEVPEGPYVVRRDAEGKPVLDPQSLQELSNRIGITEDAVADMPAWMQERLLERPEFQQQVSAEFLSGARAGRLESDITKEIADRGPEGFARYQPSLSADQPITRESAAQQVASLAERTGGEWTPLQAADSPDIGTLRIGKASIRYTYEALPEGRAASVERKPGFDYTVRIDPDNGRMSSVAHEAGHIIRDVLDDRERGLIREATGLDLNTREGDEGFARRFESAEGVRGLAEEVRKLTPENQGVVVRAVNKVIDFVNALFGSDIKHVGDAREIERLAENIEDFRVLRQLAEGERGEAREGMGEREMLAGGQARTANVGMADRAVQLERERIFPDMTPEQRDAEYRKIADETGWHRVVEGEKWMFEIDDSKMQPIQERISGLEIDETVRLSEVIDAPDLFGAYPELRELTVAFRQQEGASWDARARTISMARDELDSTNWGHFGSKTLAHEIQHAIQDIEGFRRGGSPAVSIPALDSTVANLKVQAQAKYATRSMSKEQAQKWFEDEVQFARKRVAAGARGSYLRLTGEALARVASRRLDMTPEQRKAESPRDTLKAMLVEENLMREGQQPEDVLISRGRDQEAPAPRFQDSVDRIAEDMGNRPVDSFGDVTAKLHEHVARALGKTFSGDAQEAPKDNAERAWDLLRHEAPRLPKAVREALDQLAPTKADAERLYEFREYAASNNREISNRQAEERATVFARQGTAAIEREMLRLGDNIQAVDAESRAVADAETNRIFAGLSEDEVTGLFRHLWGRQVNTEDGDPSRLSPAQREAVADMDRLMAVELDRVNYARQQEGLDPIQQLPNYFPLLRPGQFASTAEVFQAGRSMSQMFAVFNSPESIHNRDDGVKDIGVYAQDAKAQFHHYLRTMRAYSAMRTDYDGDGSRATDIYNAIHNMSRRAYTPDVIMAREAWAKAQDEGAKEPRTDLERVGADFERNLDAMRDTLAKRDMIDDVSQIPSREENRLISAASQAVNEGRMFAIRKIEAMIVHPMALVSKIDGTRTFETGELGPNERLWKRGGIDAPAFAMRLIEQMGQGLRKIMQDNGYGEHTWIRGDAKLTRINHWQERHIDDFEKMSDADVARVVEASDMPDMPIAKRLPMMFARTISESDVKAYRAILGETQRLYREAEPHFTKMYAIRHKAFKDAHFRDMGDSQSFFAKVEALVSRIAVAESQADNINAAMKLSRFYRSSGFGTEQQRAVLSDFWRDTALVSWARGPHEWDKSWFSRGLQDDKRDQQESLRSRDWLDKGRDLLNRKGVFEQVVRTTNAYLPRLFLAGNPRWSFTKQWTSVVGGAGTVGLQNLAQGMAVNAYNSLMETLASRGLVDQPAKTEGGWHGSPLREIKQRRSMAVSVNEQDQQSLRRSVRKISTSFANSLSRVMEDGLTGSMMEGALIRGRNLGMTGDRLQFFATKAAGTSQSIYNRDSRQVLLNSQIFRFFAPFQSFAFDAYTNMIWEPTRAGGMAGRERLGYVLQGMMAVAMVNYLSEWMFGRKAFQSVDPDTPSWQPWMSYGSFIPIIGAGRGPRGNYEIPAYNAVASPIYRSLQRYFETGDLVRLGKDTSPFFVAAMGLPSAQMVPQVVDTFDAMRYDGMAFTKRGVPFKALEDDSLFEYYTDIVMGLAFGPERSPTARRRIEQDRETQQQ